MTQPLDDGFFALQRDLAGEVDLDGWAKLQGSKAFRLASLILSILVFVLCLCGIAYFGDFTFVGAAVLN